MGGGGKQRSLMGIIFTIKAHFWADLGLRYALAFGRKWGGHSHSSPDASNLEANMSSSGSWEWHWGGACSVAHV